MNQQWDFPPHESSLIMTACQKGLQEAGGMVHSALCELAIDYKYSVLLEKFKSMLFAMDSGCTALSASLLKIFLSVEEK